MWTKSEPRIETMTVNGAEQHYGAVVCDVLFGGEKTGVEWLVADIWSTKRHAAAGAKAMLKKHLLRNQKSASGAKNFNDAVITTACFTPKTGGNHVIQ